MDDKLHTAEPSFPDSTVFVRDPPLATRISQYRRRLLRRQDSSQGATWVTDNLAALERGVQTLRMDGVRPGATEAAWMAVHQVRQAFCLHEDRAALIEIAHEVQVDLGDCFGTARSFHADIQVLIDELVAGEGAPSSLLRHRMYSISIVAAGKREADWRRANHVVLRRFRAAVAVVIVTFILLFALPFGFQHITVGEGFWPLVYSWAREAGCILAVLACGALGGLMSVLLRQERILLTSVEHHIIVATTRLRPIVGAASALVFFILWESGLLQMADAGHRRAGVASGTMLIMAIVAGFSERLIVGQIEKISAVLDRTPPAGSSEAAPPRTEESAPKEAAAENPETGAAAAPVA